MTDLNTLDVYLSSDDSPDECMMISDLDGFLTSLACVPEEIAEDEWLPIALGEVRRVPKEIVEIVKRRLSRRRNNLASTPPYIEPIFWEDSEGNPIAMDWCEGFMEGVKLRLELWDQLMSTDEGAEQMTPILMHVADEEGQLMFGVDEGEVAAALDAAAESIPRAVPKIHQCLWRLRHQ
ncbi:UPF0149 family protein [Limimaricola cinnabarinus]|uniref:UPF0149 family protein n=1 Tax=Limimaricola cinnabarinus TaxID=1125964 RepID=UPI0009DBBB41|nr:UPF0149 family protein [Limimaricola cinnabarinus]